MKFSAQEEYGLRCLVTLAGADDGGTMTIPVIAKAEGLTQSHVAKLLALLRKSGFINSTRGQAGGYALARPASQIRIREALDCLGGRLFADEHCSRYSGTVDECVHTSDCALHSLWSDIQSAVDSVTDRLTLDQIICNSSPIPIHLSAASGSATGPGRGKS
ncbi:MAG: Rrf2 family transcriptional regulator [Armatimonadetes bacterium]|nr:Rrf2 family transcriptional regulator [Armatimonadota bacterium]